MDFLVKNTKKKRKVNTCLLYKSYIFLFLLLVFFTSARADFTSTNFVLENPINIISGGESSSTNFQYLSTTSQLTQGQSTSSNFLQNAGFLYFPTGINPIIPPTPGSGGGGGSSYEPKQRQALRTPDFNGDGVVDILDLSILLFYYDGTGSTIYRFDLDDSGIIDFPDVSILFYYWGVFR